MLLQSIPNETLIQILHSLSSIQDVLSLSLTSHRLHDLLSRPAQRLPILFDAAERQFGPLSSAIPIVTHNSTQPPHIPRPAPPQSLSLLKQLLHIGETANAWADLYPFIHWRGTEDDCASRRLLTEQERYRIATADGPIARRFAACMADASAGRTTRFPGDDEDGGGSVCVSEQRNHHSTA
ncbi:MAG: hypothetical protein Q9200_001371 [Gallowayella weberi]